MRSLYRQLHDSLESDVWERLSADGFHDFIKLFARENEEDFQTLCNALSTNPLLRDRLCRLRKEYKTGRKMLNVLKKHEEKITWQIKRIYRTRNLSTHAGISMFYTSQVLYHIHNYFDYAINFILCKIENNDRIFSIPSLVFGAKNDNQIHESILDSDAPLSVENVDSYLFGPEPQLANYAFEVYF